MMVYNKSAHIQIEKKQEERGALQTLHGIDLKDWSLKISLIFQSFP